MMNDGDQGLPSFDGIQITAVPSVEIVPIPRCSWLVGDDPNAKWFCDDRMAYIIRGDSLCIEHGPEYWRSRGLSMVPPPDPYFVRSESNG